MPTLPDLTVRQSW